MCEIGCIFSFYRIITLCLGYAYIVTNLIKMQIPAMYVYVCVLRPISHSVSLATIGVCVFCATASVVALFYFRRVEVKRKSQSNFEKENIIMDEKILVVGNFKKENILLKVLIGITAMFLVADLICILIGCGRSMNYWETLSLHCVGTGLLVLAIVGGAFSAWMYFNMSFSELTVTDKRVYGKIKRLQRIDLPLKQISAVSQGLLQSIAISTSSNVIKFWLLNNREEVFQSISDVLAKLQNEKDTPVVVTNNSNVDEFKKYKELLDSGIITQEEFDIKKKQLLGL